MASTVLISLGFADYAIRAAFERLYDAYQLCRAEGAVVVQKAWRKVITLNDPVGV